MLLTVTASAVTVDKEVLVAKLVEYRVVVDALSVVVLPILEVEVIVMYSVAPFRASVTVLTADVIVLVVVLPLTEVVLVTTEVCVT